MNDNIEEVIKNKINKKMIENFLIENKISKTKFCQIYKIGLRSFNNIILGQDFNLKTLFKIAKVMKVQAVDLMVRF